MSEQKTEDHVQVILLKAYRLLNPNHPLGWLTSKEYQDGFSETYSICTARNWQTHLRDYTESALNKMIEKFCTETLNYIKSVSRSEILKVYNDATAKFLRNSMLMDYMLRYIYTHSLISMECVMSTKNENPSIRKKCLTQWESIVMEPLLNSHSLLHYGMEQLEEHRIAYVGDIHLLKTFSNSTHAICSDELHHPSFYGTHYLSVLQGCTSSFYETMAKDMMSRMGVGEYLEKTEEIIAREDSRAPHIVHISFVQSIISICEKEMIQEAFSFIQSEFADMIQSSRLHDLRRCHVLFKRVNNGEGLKELFRMYQSYVQNQGKKIPLTVEVYKEDTLWNYIDSFLELYSKEKKVLREIFSDNLDALKAFDDGFKSSINTRTKANGYPAEMLSKACDSILRAPDQNLEKLEAILLHLFIYLDDKDLFQKFYSKQLARRLISKTSSCEDGEATALRLLKSMCGFEYTNKFERMFSDMKLSETLNQQFQESEECSQLERASLKMIVLQTACWPLPSSLTPEERMVEMAPDISSPLRLFEQFYVKQHESRTLSYQYPLCTVDLNITFPKGLYEFTCTAYQANVLLLFKTKPKQTYTYGEIKSLTLISDKDLSRVIRSLVTCVLVKTSIKPTDDEESRSQEYIFPEETIVEFNTKYANKKRKIKISSALPKETITEAASTVESINEDRNLALQAIIIRIMKAKKTMRYQDILVKTIDDCKHFFIPTIPLIKKTIDVLIEKEYLARDENDRNTINYLA
jgi:hypothetical protein